METLGASEERRRLRIVGSELVESYTVYIIEVVVGGHRWTIKHRYSDFYDLHEKLTADRKIDKNLLPPKKMIGKNSKSLVEKRQKELEVYLDTLLAKFPLVVPKVLSCFLHFNLYEINGITAVLAEELFHKGEQLLAAGEVFLLRPLQLYAVTQQLRLAKPTCANGDAKADLGHILDFTCRLKYLKVPGIVGAVGTSNIQEHLLPFDLSIFKSLLQIEISRCESKQIKELPSLKPTLATITIHHCVASMRDILVPEASEFAQWEAEGGASDGSVTAVIPTWRSLTTLDMSHNSLRCIDDSVKLIPKVEFLDLSYNEISLVENLQHLYSLIHLDLSYNKLTVLEGLHTKLGNVKTLNLAGNHLECLSGLNKLYSLVNLDLGCNKLAELNEIRHIGALPCLEKLSLVSNPMCIMPDYRTKVLAQFWDRASEVCLDCTPATEKELDTVEVLKAIQKAKEAKDRMANNEKKMDVDCRLLSAGSHSPATSLAAPPSSSSLSHSSSSSQEVICKEEAIVTAKILTPVDSQMTHQCYFVQNTLCEETMQPLPTCVSPDLASDHQCSCCCCTGNKTSFPDSNLTPVVPFSLLSYTVENLDFAAQLSGLVGKVLWERESTTGIVEKGESQQGEVVVPNDWYFEISPGGGDEDGRSPDTVEEEVEEVELARIKWLLWALCMRVDPAGLSQMLCCVALTERWLMLFRVGGGQSHRSAQELVGGLEVELAVPYADVEAAGPHLSEVCLSLRVRHSEAAWHVLSDTQSLKQVHSQMKERCGDSGVAQKCLIQQLLSSWECEECDSSLSGTFLVHLVEPSASSAGASTPPRSDVLSHRCTASAYTPCLLFLTARHLCVAKVDFAGLAQGFPQGSRSCVKLTRVPLASVLLRPRRGCPGDGGGDGFQDGHVLELMMGHEAVLAVFLMQHDKFLFLRQLSQLRSSLRDIKTVVFLQNTPCQRKAARHLTSSKGSQRAPASCVNRSLQRPHLTLSLLYPTEQLELRFSEENQCPTHLTLSPALRFISGLTGAELVEFFYSSVAEVENEELRHILWSSVLFYKSPDVEVTACVMLSTKALYFILDDTASTLSDQALLWNWHPSEQRDADFIISHSFTMKLKDLQSVNVGLFDQYFRVVGSSADHIICCLTRESYSTHRFLQQLMAVLSLLEKLPSPEPSEQDFYTQFGKKNTGKMENYELVHPSKVKFIYPSEEEIGDLAFIVAERKGSPAFGCTFNILLYVLAFQIPNPSGPAPVSLQPKTLILTATDIFLLDEDYVSYPLPDFAKEPPPREKYRLTEARRIRDLDRVLLGYQTAPQALTLVFDDLPGPDLLCQLTLDHFAADVGGAAVTPGDQNEVQWCVFVPGSDGRERLISLLARQWEALCSRELPVELTG